MFIKCKLTRKDLITCNDELVYVEFKTPPLNGLYKVYVDDLNKSVSLISERPSKLVLNWRFNLITSIYKIN